MNFSPVFKNMCLRVGRAFGVVAEREVSAAPAAHLSRDVLAIQSRGLTQQRMHPAVMAKAVSPVVALKPELRKIIDETIPIEFYGGDQVGALLPARDVKFNAILEVVERIPGWGNDPTLKKIQALAKDGLGDSAVNARRTVDDAARY